MGTFLYIISLLLVITWAVGSVAYNANGSMHLLLLAALGIGILRLSLNRKPVSGYLRNHRGF